ncbi:hypothetical protein K492DRAFT_200645 [Lichtheimia hyalospora FSU 10163]|nr:hypothetical protein K492DRAFT_200645 [Lichtheimia hyalospora FSU 10163]
MSTSHITSVTLATDLRLTSGSRVPRSLHRHPLGSAYNLAQQDLVRREIRDERDETRKCQPLLVPITTRYHEYICSYINDNDGTVSLAKFLNDEVDFIASHIDINEDYRSNWAARFTAACTSLNVTPKQCKPNWGPIAIAILDHIAKVADSSSMPTTSESVSSDAIPQTSSILSASSSSSSSKHTRKLSISDRKRITEMYDALNVGQMWTLSTGTKVENKMRELAVKCNYEHPCHSMILDPSDKMWMDIFSGDELKDIRMHKAPEVTALPHDLHEFINTFDDKHDLFELYDHACTFKFDPIQQPDLHWVHHSVLQALNLLFCKYLEKDRTEADLLRRAWSFIDTCFDATNIDVISGEKSSKAASERFNQGRTLAAVDPMIQRKNGVKVDMLFPTARFELGSV